ncbi:MAG: YitT family protein [Lachnospiraceae bacterium]|nr:YitT family protein [Lachnospiraceae bacterium]
MPKSKSSKMIAGIKKYITIFLGAIFYAAGIAFFLNPNDLAPGGVTGIAILLNRFVPIETGTLILLLNIPIILLGIWKFGWKFIVSTIYTLIMVSGLTNVMEYIGPLTEDRMLAAIVGAVLVGTGIGIVFKAGSTTGGIDIIIKIIKQKFPHKKTGSLFLLFDSAVIIAAGIVFGNIEASIYASIATVVSMYTLDAVLYGKDGARLIYIISDHADALTESLLHEAGLGVTWLYGEGTFQNKEKKIIMCVADKKKALQVEEIVKEHDPASFMIVSSASEIYGEGYKNIFAEKI